MTKLKYCVIILMFLIAVAQAYELKDCNGDDLSWADHSQNVYASSVSFSSGDPYTTALDYALDAISDAPSTFSLNRISDSSGVSRGNGQSETWFSVDPVALDGAPAIAWTWSNCWSFLFWGGNGISEVDVIFDADFNYTSGTSKSVMNEYGGSSRPFRNTAIHEFAHFAGLAHENDEYNVLGQSYSHIHANGSTARGYVGEDVADALVDLYGDVTLGGLVPASTLNAEDVGVTHFMYSGRSGEYSTHDRTIMTNTSGVELSHFTEDDEPIYKVTPGQKVKVEFNFENNGLSKQSGVEVGYYISTNNTISTFDDRIAGKTLTLGRNATYVSAKSLTIPSTLTPGNRYWLGVIIDEDGLIPEPIEWNNATYIEIEIQ